MAAAGRPLVERGGGRAGSGGGSKPALGGRLAERAAAFRRQADRANAAERRDARAARIDAKRMSAAEVRAPHSMDYPPKRWPESPQTAVQRVPCEQQLALITSNRVPFQFRERYLAPSLECDTAPLSSSLAENRRIALVAGLHGELESSGIIDQLRGAFSESVCGPNLQFGTSAAVVTR